MARVIIEMSVLSAISLIRRITGRTADTEVHKGESDRMKDIIIVGAGGFGRELLQWIKDVNRASPTWNIKGFIDDNLNALDGIRCDYAVIGKISEWTPSENELFAMAIANPKVKETLTGQLKDRGAVFTPVIHPTAIVSDLADVGEGLIAYPGAGINPNTVIGDFVTLLRSTVGHDAHVGSFCTISSYCDITAGVELEKYVFLGSHATLIPHIRVGEGAYISAGSVVIKNVKPGMKMFGNPAKELMF